MRLRRWLALTLLALLSLADAHAKNKALSFGSVVLTTVADWPSALEVHDMNGDAAADLVVLSLGKGSRTLMSVHHGDGAGGFGSAEAIDIGEMVVAVAIADFDEDGHADVIAPRYREKDLSLLTGNGQGGFRSSRQTKVSRKPVSATAADLNGDGHADVVVAYLKHVQVFLGNGKGKLSALAAIEIGSGVDGPVVADLDGDGRPDLLMVSNDDNRFVTLVGAGKGKFTPGFSGASCESPAYPQLGDFDGDGATDVAYACVGAGEPGFEVRLTRKGGREFVTVKVAANPVENMVVGDFTGDGALDVASMGRGSSSIASQLRLHAGDGKGGFALRCEGQSTGFVNDPNAVDVTGDGRVDLLASFWPGREPGSVGLWSSVCR